MCTPEDGMMRPKHGWALTTREVNQIRVYLHSDFHLTLTGLAEANE
jgi:hypothetical protein